MMNMATLDNDLQAEHRYLTSLVGHLKPTALNQMIVSFLTELNRRRKTSSLNAASYWEQMKRNAKVGQMIMMRNLVGLNSETSFLSVIIKVGAFLCFNFGMST